MSEVLSPSPSLAAEAPAPGNPVPSWRAALPFVALTAAVAALLLTAPYGKDMWWSDAPRHAMDGAFYRDLARQVIGHMPLANVKQFAMNYYLKYPALTILFYPPLFPFVEGGFFGIFGVSLFTALMAVSAFYLALAWGSYVLCRRWMDRAPALAATLLFVGAPEVASWGRQVMLEIPACAFLVWSAVAFLRYADRRKPAMAYVLALLLAGGAYTKQTVLFIVPALLWTLWKKRGASMLRDRHLWGSAALLTALVAPLAALNLTLARLNVGSVVGGRWNQIPVFSWEGLSFYARMLPGQVTWPVALLALIGVGAAAFQKKWGEGESFFLAWLAVGYIFFSLIALKEPRHTVTILLPMAFFAVRAIRAIAGARLAPALATLFAAVIFSNTLWRHPAPYVDGYGQAADYVVSRAPRGSVILFSGYRDGAFVFDVRRRVDRPDLWVLRADKLLLRVPQRRELGLEELKVSEADTLDMINRFGVSYVVNQANFWDDLKNMQQLQHVLHSSQFRKVAVIPVSSNVNHEDRELEIYQNLAPAKVKVKERLKLELPIIGIQVEGTIDSSDTTGGAR